MTLDSGPVVECVLGIKIDTELIALWLSNPTVMSVSVKSNFHTWRLWIFVLTNVSTFVCSAIAAQFPKTLWSFPSFDVFPWKVYKTQETNVSALMN